MELTKADMALILRVLRKEKERQKGDPAYGYGTGIVGVVQPSPLADWIYSDQEYDK